MVIKTIEMSTENKKPTIDYLLLQAYLLGLSDELDNKKEYTPYYVMFRTLRAYKLGQIDAKLGDESNSINYRSTEDTIKIIKS